MGNLNIPTTTPPSDRFDLNSYPLSGQLMFYTVLALSGILAFLFCFYFYTRWLELRNHFLLHRHHHTTPAASLHTNQLPITTTTRPRRGLEKSVLKSLPTFTYAAAADADHDDCAVCLSEFNKGDLARLLPGCGHVFHADCIDLWFRSHSNCPLCRAAVKETKLDPANDPYGDLVDISVVVPDSTGVERSGSGGLNSVRDGSVRSDGGRVALNPVECRRKSLDLADVLLLTELNSPNRVGLLGRSETVDLEAGWIWASAAAAVTGVGSGDESGSDSPGSRGSSTLKRYMSV